MPSKPSEKPYIRRPRDTGSARPGNRAGSGSLDERMETAGGRREQILNAAAKLFAEFGYEATSMRHIAKEVDILAPSIYYHFTTKEDILHEIVREPLEQWRTECDYICRMPVDSEMILICILLNRFYNLYNNWEFHTVISQESQYMRRNTSFSYVDSLKADTFRMQEDIFRKGIEAGLFHTKIDIGLAIITIARMLASAAKWFRDGYLFSADMPADYTYDTVVDFHLDAILRMLRTPARLENPIPREICERLSGIRTHDVPLNLARHR